MTAAAIVLFALFFVMMIAGTPIGVALGLAGTVAVWMADLGLLSVPTNLYTGIAKYPLLAIPMFVLAGAIFDRSGVADRLIRFAIAIIGDRPGSLAVVTIMVAMFLGGISGSGPANAAAVGGIMIGYMQRAGYPPAFSASVVGAAAATDILIPPSIAFIVYSVMVPQASVQALFAAGMIPGILAGLALVLPAVLISRRHGFGAGGQRVARPPFWRSLREAAWGLFAPVLILGGMRIGLFTPTEAAVAAVAYGLFVGVVVHRTMSLRDLPRMMAEAADISAVILIIVALASIFAWAGSTLGLFSPIARAIMGISDNQYVVMAVLIVALIIIGMFLDGVSTFLILLPLLMPIANHFRWDPVWFGVILTMKVAIGQFTPPMAVNLMVSCRIAGVPIESTVRWVGWMLVAMMLALVLVVAFPELALWLPRTLGY